MNKRIPLRTLLILFSLAGALSGMAQPKALPTAAPVTIKVAVVLQDPPIPWMGNKRMHELFKTPGYRFSWHDPRDLMKAYLDTLNAVCHGAVKFEIVKVYDDSLFFTHLKGQDELLSLHRIVDLLQEPDWATFRKQGTSFDYNRFIEHYGFCSMRDKGEINEVWLWSFPYGGTWESTFAGKNAFWLNSDPVKGSSCNELLTIMGLNYEREMSMGLESFGHRIESVMRKVYGRWDNTAPDRNNWELYSSYDKKVPGQAHVGNIHFPPNGVKDYDWINNTPVVSMADTWAYYPNLDAMPGRIVDCREWHCTHLGYMTWWMRHLPHFAGLNEADGHLNNWWYYVVDYNKAMTLEKKLAKRGRK